MMPVVFFLSWGAGCGLSGVRRGVRCDGGVWACRRVGVGRVRVGVCVVGVACWRVWCGMRGVACGELGVRWLAVRAGVGVWGVGLRVLGVGCGL